MNSSRKSSQLALRICKSCGKPVGQQNVGSLTSWLFQDAVCQCTLTDGTSEKRNVISTQQFLADVSDLPDLGKSYAVIERIGKGGMGSVYRAIDNKENRPVAIKVLHDYLLNDRQAVSRFQQEAEAVISLSHENMVKAFAWDSSPSGAPFLVMEYAEGESLERLLKSETYIEARQAVEMFLQICSALSYAHQHRIIHRDVKPGNIILTKDEAGVRTAKLVDFGIAKVHSVADRGTRDLTQTGEVFGSPHYMSPEQCLGFELDSRSDIYSLGCVMYECLSGKPPFEGHNPVQLIAKHLSADLPTLRICDSSMSTRFNLKLEEIIAKCLAKEPESRYMSVELLAAQLRDLIDENQSPEAALPQLGRKLDLIRMAFLLLVVLSIISGGLTLLPVSAGISQFYALTLILPAVASLLACWMINDRMKEIVLRMQFQAIASRDLAVGCSSALSLCMIGAAICFVGCLSSIFLAQDKASLPILAGGFSVVLVAIVWAAFLQRLEKQELTASILSGKLVCVVSIFLIAGLTVYASLSHFTGTESSHASGNQTDTKGPDTEKIEGTFFGALPTEYAANIGLDLSKRRISKLEKKGDVWLRVFKFPQGMDLGVFTCEGENKPARGSVEFPADKPLHLQLSSNACTSFAPALRGFAADDVSSLTIGEYASKLKWIECADDVMYYIGAWQGLVALFASDTDLSNFGLSKLKKCRKLKSLSVARTLVTPNAVISLPQLKNLRMLDVGFIQSSGSIVKAMQGTPSLEVLIINNVGLKNQDLAEIAKFPNLQILDLGKNMHINDEAARSLSAMTKLRVLSLAGTSVSDKSLPYISKLTSLKSLLLDGANWSQSSVDALARNLPKECKIAKYDGGTILDP